MKTYIVTYKHQFNTRETDLKKKKFPYTLILPPFPIYSHQIVEKRYSSNMIITKMVIDRSCLRNWETI